MDMTEQFDIDNVDVEEEMLRRDIAEEEEAAEKEAKEKEEAAARNAFKKSRSVLNAKNLTSDLKISTEARRTVYTWKHNDQLWTGYVTYKFDNDAFIFNASVVGSDEPAKLKKFRLSEIK